MRALDGDHGPDCFRSVQEISGGFNTPKPFTRSLANVMGCSRLHPDQAVSAFDFSSAILDWQRLVTRSRSVRAFAMSHSRSSAEASYWSL